MSDDADRIGVEASDWLVRLREAPEDRELHARFRRWRDAHPDHARTWEEMQALFGLMGGVAPAHPDYLVPTSKAVPGTAAAPAVPRRRSWRVPAAAALAACLAIFVLGPGIVLRMQADYVTAAGHMEQVTLADGSRVHLGPDSAIAVDYGAGRRDLRLLRGQAWFDVQPDAARPFRVRAETLTATALGTAFDVRMIGAEKTVAVGHGRVRVRGGAVQGSVLAAGDWISVDAGHRAATGHQAADLAGLWQTGSVPIRGRTVADAVEELRPWYNGRIVLADDAIGGKRVTGIFRLSDPQEALRALIEPHGGRILRITPWLMIVTR